MPRKPVHKHLSTQDQETLRQCYAILGAIAKKPQAAKLLPGVREDLKLWLNYKSGRADRWRSPASLDTDPAE